MDTFDKILNKFKFKLTPLDRQELELSFPGRDEGQRKRINIGRIYDQKYNMLINKVYKKVNVHENTGEDDPVDTSGYIGQFYREKQTLLPFTESQLIRLFQQNNKLADLMRTIMSIDS